MQPSYIYFPFILLSLALPCTSVALIDNLKNTCPMESDVSAMYLMKKNQFKANNQGKVFPGHLLTEYYDLKNLDALSQILFSDTKYLGAGTFGKVYAFNYVDPVTHKSLEIVSKVVRFPADGRISENAEIQQELAMEIYANQQIFQEPLGKFFFPQVFGCFEITSKIDSLSQQLDFSKLPKNEQVNITHKPEEGMATIFVEKLSISLADFMDLTFDGKAFFLDHERLSLLLQAVKGLGIMDQFFVHCDIKPDNMMLKQILVDDIVEMAQSKVSSARFNHNQFYQLKYIDFGLISFDQPENRECNGGTPGFIPDEYLQRNVSNEKFDVYLSGMTFLDLELNKKEAMKASVVSTGSCTDARRRAGIS